jgi:hypothetical protein
MEMVIPGIIFFFRKSQEIFRKRPLRSARRIDVPIYVLLTRVSSHDQINSQFK